MPVDKALPSGGQEFERSPEDYGPKQELYGLFRAVIEDTNDPEFRCRVKVRIDGLHSNDVGRVPTKSIMWAELLPQDGGGRNHGDHTVPYAYGDTVGVIMLRGRCAPFPLAFIVGAWSGMLENKDDVGKTASEHYGAGPTETVSAGAAGVPPTNNDAFRYPEVPREVWQYFDRYDKPKKESNGEPKVKPYEIYPRRRVIKSRHGHVIEISDEPADYEIIIRTPIGQRIWLRESCRNATEERPIWVDGLDTGEKVCRKTSKMFPKGMELRDDRGNYFHMNTEDGLLDVYWNGDKREVINGAYHQTVMGHVIRKVGHFTQEEYGFNPQRLDNTAPHPLWMQEDGGPNPNCPHDNTKNPPSHWVKRLYHNYVEETMKSDFYRWVQGHFTTVVAVGNYLLDMLAEQRDKSVARYRRIIRLGNVMEDQVKGSELHVLREGDQKVDLANGHRTLVNRLKNNYEVVETGNIETTVQTADMIDVVKGKILQAATGIHNTWGSIIDHNPPSAPPVTQPVCPSLGTPAVTPGVALVKPSAYVEPTAAEYPYPYCNTPFGEPGNCLNNEDCNCDCKAES
jgi:hypothetical protein